MADRWENNGNSDRLYFLRLQNPWMAIVAMKLKDACSLEEKLLTNLNNILKSRDVALPTEVHIVNAVVFQ